MYLQVPLYKYKLCSTYGYLRTSINSITPTGDLNKYKSAISISKCPMGDLNKYKFVISTRTCISLLYEFMNNSYICYYTFVTVICLLEMSISACVYV